MILEVNEWEPDPKQIAETLNLVLRGRSNATGSFTLTANATSTDVEDNLFSSTQVPLLVPASATAATATVWISSRTEGGFTVGHDSTSDTDREFIYVRSG